MGVRVSWTALPTQTFAATRRIDANGDQLVLGKIPNAPTNSDIYIKFQKANVLHLGDVFFNGMYPFIDAKGAVNIAATATSCRCQSSKWPETREPASESCLQIPAA